MKIGVISDTHGSAAAWEAAVARFAGADLVLHAGDVFYHGPRNPFPERYSPPELAQLLNHAPWPLVIARGNCDAEVDQAVLDLPLQAPYALVVQGWARFLIHHGDGLTPEGMVHLARRLQVRFFITGHTHIPLLAEKEGVILLNPGSPALPKGLEGATVGLIHLEEAEGKGRVQVVSLATGEEVQGLSLA